MADPKVSFIWRFHCIISAGGCVGFMQTKLSGTVIAISQMISHGMQPDVDFVCYNCLTSQKSTD